MKHLKAIQELRAAMRHASPSQLAIARAEVTAGRKLNPDAEAVAKAMADAAITKAAGKLH